MRYALDNSVAMRWLLNDRPSDMQDYARSVLQILANGDTAVVPKLRSLEAANVLAKSQKQGLDIEADAHGFLTLLSDLNIETDPFTHERALHDALATAVRQDSGATTQHDVWRIRNPLPYRANRSRQAGVEGSPREELFAFSAEVAGNRIRRKVRPRLRSGRNPATGVFVNQDTDARILSYRKKFRQ